MADPVIADGGFAAPSSTNVDCGKVSAMCSEPVNPLNLTGSLIWILREHFRHPDKLRMPNLKDYLWDENDQLSKIKITSGTEWDPKVLMQRPAIVVRREAWTTGKLGIGDSKYQGGSPISEERMASGQTKIVDSSNKYEIMIAGSHTLFCVAGTGAEAETLGTEVFLQLIEFGPVMRQEFSLGEFMVKAMGPAGKLEESHEHWGVPVQVVYGKTHSWSLRKVGPTLKGLSINTTV
jgi:hypothetical protein